jgi:cobalamin biosynthesis protein CobT
MLKSDHYQISVDNDILNISVDLVDFNDNVKITKLMNKLIFLDNLEDNQDNQDNQDKQDKQDKQDNQDDKDNQDDNQDNKDNQNNKDAEKNRERSKSSIKFTNESPSKMLNQSIFYYKCEGFNEAYIPLNKILPEMSEIEFSRFDYRLIRRSFKDLGVTNLLYVKNGKMNKKQYMAMVIIINNRDIIVNLTIFGKVIEAVAKLW